MSGIMFGFVKYVSTEYQFLIDTSIMEQKLCQ